MAYIQYFSAARLFEGAAPGKLRLVGAAQLPSGVVSRCANNTRNLVGAGSNAEEMNAARDFVVVDVETSGFDPAPPAC